MYNCYVVGSIFGGSWLMTQPSHAWISYSTPMCAFLTSVQENYNSVLVDVLQNCDLSQFPPGSHLYIGYGTSSDEMMSAGRYNTYNVG